MPVPFLMVEPSEDAARSCYGHRADVYFDNRQFARGSQLSKSNPLFVTKKSHGTGIKYSGQLRQDGLRLVSKGSRTIFKQRSRAKSSVTALKKKSSMDKTSKNIAETACYYSMYQNFKFNNSLISKRHMSQSVIARNIIARNLTRNNSSVAFVEKCPRSYAEIIADYSKTFCKRSMNDAHKDSLYFNNAIWQSPFGTSSIPSLNKKLAAEHCEIPTKGQENHSIFLADDLNPINQHHRQGNINVTHKHRHSQRYDTCDNEITNKSANQEHVITSDFTSEDNSYMKLATDCSKSAHTSLACTSNPGLIPSRNVLARSSHELFGTPMRKASSTNMRELQKAIPIIAPTMPLGSGIEQQTSDSQEDDWLREIESVISDLRSASERKIARPANVLGLRESSVSQPVDASSNALDRIQNLAELIKTHKQGERDTAGKKLGESKYFSNMANTVSSRKHFQRAPTINGTVSALKQPQVELRMVPSETESVVSINVDSASTGLSQDPVNPGLEQLFVVVQSDRKEDRQSSEARWDTPTFHSGNKTRAPQRNDFGPMRISISEDSAPVKQIEFSINGKPVSELKSITARTERLDVVSSVDKIEIRIPFAKDDASSKTKGSELSKQIEGGQILNVQIVANFQNEPGKDGGERSVGTINTMPASSHIPRTRQAFNDRIRAETSSNDAARQHGSSTWPDIRSDDTTEGDINEHETSGNVNRKMQRATTKKLSADKTTANVPLIKKATDTKAGRWNMKKMVSSESPETNKYNKNESPDPRVPSKVVPWWSSSDSFRKIRRKDDDCKLVTPNREINRNKINRNEINRNEKRTISSLTENFVTESLPLKSKETSSPKLQTKNMDVTTNNSNNLVSYAGSVERHGTSKLPDRYPYRFRLKPNQENPGTTSKIMGTGLKTEDDQTSDIKGLKISFPENKQTNQVTLSTLDTMNKQDDVSTEKEKIYISAKNAKVSSGQNLPLKNHEQYSLEQTNSTDDASSVKLRIENIVDAIKPIEKREDGTLIDYGLKVSSRKPIAELTREIDKSQNSISRKRRDPITDKYNEIQRNMMKYDINAAKTIQKIFDKKNSAKQTEVDEIKKAETKMNTLKKKNDLTVKNNSITDIKKQNENEMTNMKNMHNNDATTTNPPNSSSGLVQASKKNERLVGDVVQNSPTQDSKSLPESNKYRSNHLSGIRNSSGTISRSKQLRTSTKMSSREPKQDRQKYLSSDIPKTKIEESEKRNNLESPKSKDNSSKESNKKIAEIITKSRNLGTNKIAATDKSYATQTKSSPTSKTSQSKDSVTSKDLLSKNAREMPITNRTDDIVEDTVVAKTITQSPKIGSLVSKDSEDKSKSSRNRKNSSDESDDFPKKTDGSTGFKTSSPKTCVASREQPIECFPRPQRILTISRNPNRTVDNISEHVTSLMGSTGPDMDRPEKRKLYSVWLQESKNDNDNNEKLF